MIKTIALNSARRLGFFYIIKFPKLALFPSSGEQKLY